MRVHAKYEGLSNLYGELSDDVRARLEAFFEDPCEATWDDAHCIILSAGSFATFWQAVIAVDPTFPRSKPERKPWPRVPDFFTARRALEHVRKGGKVR